MTAHDSAPDRHAVPDAGASSAPRGVGLVQRAAVFVGTILVLIALAVLPLLTPFFIHPALDAADSATRLGLEPAQTQQLSDRSVQELVMGLGGFTFKGSDGRPFYDAAERSHLADARVLLWLFLGAGAISAIVAGSILARASTPDRATLWKVVSRAGASTAIAVVVLGVASVVAFGTLFTLFHQVFFPAGNWSFDPDTQRLVQLYPFGFWQIAAAALGLLLAVLGLGTWLVGRRLSRRQASDSHVDPAPVGAHG